jgi:hypothetical protein
MKQGEWTRLGVPPAPATAAMPARSSRVRQVHAAPGGGRTWNEIAAALGVSRHAARKRFDNPAPTRSAPRSDAGPRTAPTGRRPQAGRLTSVERNSAAEAGGTAGRRHSCLLRSLLESRLGTDLLARVGVGQAVLGSSLQAQRNKTPRWAHARISNAAPAGCIGDSRASWVMRSSANGTPTTPASDGPEATTSPSALTLTSWSKTA